MQFLSSQQMKDRKEQPWHRLQLEHIRPSAHVPYLATGQHTIQIVSRWKQCNGINILLSPPELAAAHLGRPLQTHGVAAGVPRGAVPAVRLRHRGLAGRVLGAGGGQRVTCNTLTSLQFYKWIIMPIKQNLHFARQTATVSSSFALVMVMVTSRDLSGRGSVQPLSSPSRAAPAQQQAPTER